MRRGSIVKKKGELTKGFKYASEALKNDRDVVMAALCNDGETAPKYEDLNEELRRDPEIVKLAIRNDGAQKPKP